MRWILILFALLVSTSAQAQNLTGGRLQLLPMTPTACPTGRVCVIGTNMTTPNLVGFQDTGGNTVWMGDAWRLRACTGPCTGMVNGDVYFDLSTGKSYVKQSGAYLPIGLGTSPSFAGTITGTYSLGGTPSLAAALNAATYKITSLGTPTAATDAATKGYVDSAVLGAGYVPPSRNVATAAPLTGGGDLSANRTLGLSYASDMTMAGGSLALSANVRASVNAWHLQNGSSIGLLRYWGPSGDTATSATLVSPLVVPCTGNVTALYVQGNSNAVAVADLTLYKSAGGATIAYAATAATCSIAIGAKHCSDASTVAVTAGDLLLLYSAAGWAPTGGSASIRIVCGP